MCEYILRDWQPGDDGALKTLWKTCFGDTDEFIDGFFDLFPRQDACVVAEADGRPVSAMYILPGQHLFPYRKKTLTAGYAYALATLPEYRNRGIGRAVYKAVSDRILQTADAACVLPAEQTLYPFYENAAGAAPLSYIREARLTKADLAGITPSMGARFPTLEYQAVRSQILSGLPYAVLPEEFYELMEASGVEFFVLEHGVAAAETSNGVCRILELLDPDTDAMSSIAGVARWCRAEEYIVRSPLFFDGPGEARPYMLAALKQPPSFPMTGDLWWGLGLE